MHTTRLLRAGAAATAALSALAVGPAAHALPGQPAAPTTVVVAISGSTITVTGTGVADNVRGYGRDGGSVMVFSTNPFAPTTPPAVSAGPGCTAFVESGRTNVSCPTAGISTISWKMGNGDDVVDTTTDQVAARSLVDGGAGNDNLSARVTGVVSGGIGNDTVLGGANPGHLDLLGDAGADTITMLGDPDQPTRADGGSGNDTITGSGHGDRLEGGSGVDTIRGGGGTDVILGGDQNDVLMGEGDPDVILGGGSNDTIDGGDDWDFLDGGAGNDTINGGTDTTGTTTAEELYGGFGADTLTAGNRPAKLMSGEGNDTVRSTNGVVDVSIDCGEGADRFRTDANDPSPWSCETLVA